MDIWTVEDGQLVLYKRRGECNGCGQCCCTHTVQFQVEVSVKRDDESNGDFDDDFDWSCREGWSMFLAQGLWWYFEATSVDKPLHCEQLDENNKCRVWMDVDKFPAICRYWPFHPSNLEQFPQCSFTFERQEDDENQA